MNTFNNQLKQSQFNLNKPPQIHQQINQQNPAQAALNHYDQQSAGKNQIIDLDNWNQLGDYKLTNKKVPFRNWNKIKWKKFNNKIKFRLTLQPIFKLFLRIYRNIHECEIICQICLYEESEVDDSIISCSYCLASAHQQCYGRELHPHQINKYDEFICERCYHLQTRNLNFTNIKCKFCTDYRGIMRKLKNNEWVHFTCLNWIPEIYPQDEIELIKIIGTLKPKRLNQKCYICNTKDDSVALQCDYYKCVRWFHIRCAIELKIIRPVEALKGQNDPLNEYNYAIFCADHEVKAVSEIKEKGFYQTVKREDFISSESSIKKKERYLTTSIRQYSGGTKNCQKKTSRLKRKRWNDLGDFVVTEEGILLSQGSTDDQNEQEYQIDQDDDEEYYQGKVKKRSGNQSNKYGFTKAQRTKRFYLQKGKSKKMERSRSRDIPINNRKGQKRKEITHLNSQEFYGDLLSKQNLHKYDSLMYQNQRQEPYVNLQPIDHQNQYVSRPCSSIPVNMQHLSRPVSPIPNNNNNAQYLSRPQSPVLYQAENNYISRPGSPIPLERSKAIQLNYFGEKRKSRKKGGLGQNKAQQQNQHQIQEVMDPNHIDNWNEKIIQSQNQVQNDMQNQKPKQRNQNNSSSNTDVSDNQIQYNSPQRSDMIQIDFTTQKFLMNCQELREILGLQQDQSFTIQEFSEKLQQYALQEGFAAFTGEICDYYLIRQDPKMVEIFQKYSSDQSIPKFVKVGEEYHTFKIFLMECSSMEGGISNQEDESIFLQEDDEEENMDNYLEVDNDILMNKGSALNQELSEHFCLTNVTILKIEIACQSNS
eukprot:403336621